MVPTKKQLRMVDGRLTFSEGKLTRVHTCVGNILFEMKFVIVNQGQDKVDFDILFEIKWLIAADARTWWKTSMEENWPL
ncbi:hypothetical protein R1flu_005542 [Riccia fluitans]|uniref:Uncharacterized protein n=1 Tax=Riccia fluitans TaxID=41844 RepID=A0ABD1YTP6_9MARC